MFPTRKACPICCWRNCRIGQMAVFHQVPVSGKQEEQTRFGADDAAHFKHGCLPRNIIAP